MIQKIENTTNGFVDTFNFFMIENLKLVGKMELPYISKYSGPLPTKIVGFSKKVSNPQDYFVHHYLYDYRFDGRNGIWYGCQKGSKKLNFILSKYRKYQGVISSDFSVYVDLPLAAQIWNIYRDRTNCAWLRSLGLNVIFNLRWGDYRTYEYVFYGIEKHSVIAVGSHGLVKKPENRQIFMDGFSEMIRRVEPAHIVVYGPCLKDMATICQKNGVFVTQFDSEQTEARKKEG